MKTKQKEALDKFEDVLDLVKGYGKAYDTPQEAFNDIHDELDIHTTDYQAYDDLSENLDDMDSEELEQAYLWSKAR